MIKNRRKLSIVLMNGGKIELSKISKKLNRIIEMWVSYKSVKIEGSFLIGTY